MKLSIIMKVSCLLLYLQLVGLNIHYAFHPLLIISLHWCWHQLEKKRGVLLTSWFVLSQLLSSILFHSIDLNSRNSLGKSLNSMNIIPFSFLANFFVLSFSGYCFWFHAREKICVRLWFSNYYIFSSFIHYFGLIFVRWHS
jgi:hypothetical protein